VPCRAAHLAISRLGITCTHVACCLGLELEQCLLSIFSWRRFFSLPCTVHVHVVAVNFFLSSDLRKHREIRPKKRRDETRRLKVPLAAERPGTSLRGGATSLPPTTTTRRRTDLSTSGIGAELRETLILSSAGLRASPGHVSQLEEMQRAAGGSQAPSSIAHRPPSSSGSAPSC
jgi:hypothetical protein